MLSLILHLDEAGKKMGIDYLEQGVHVYKVFFRKRRDNVEGAAVQGFSRL